MIKKLLPFATALCLLAGCATQNLWETYNPNDRIWIPSDQITEDELKNREVEYEKIISDKNDGYVVEKDTLEKFTDYTYRTLGTPFTVVTDTAIVATVVGVAWIEQKVEEMRDGSGSRSYQWGL
jgi:hypothetical protein